MTKRRKKYQEKEEIRHLTHLRDWSSPHQITGRSQSV